MTPRHYEAQTPLQALLMEQALVMAQARSRAASPDGKVLDRLEVAARDLACLAFQHAAQGLIGQKKWRTAMRRRDAWALTLTLGCCLVALLARAADPTDDELRKKPITTDPSLIGKLLRDWDRAGTAAGNVGDYYDNRDGEHSPLDLRPWPQLRKVAYTPEDVRLRRHWALQPRTLPHVTFGNSSTSAPPTAGGSNPRMYYVSEEGLAILESHYLKNNVYIYPEHRDHDPGHNGVGDGYGDLYPTNTPYLIISQGSSGSDQPFMRAIPYTLAAFRPEVKKLLVEKGLLMPTLQRVFRATNKHLKKPDEYFTGKAHPTVFEGLWVDALGMARMAHEITKETIPPLVKLRVVEEEAPVNGRDFFDLPGRSEKLADTACVIARVWRGVSGKRRVVLSAKDSIDVNGKDLTFRWVVLRGDEKRIDIKPRGKGNAEAEIVIRYHERRPIAPGSPMESNRVDIGVFAENGKAVSAPAFFTYFTLDDEARQYEDGRIKSVGHSMGLNELKVTNWPKALAELAKDGPAARVLGVKEAQREALGPIGKKVGMMQELLDGARTDRQRPEKERNEASAKRQKAEQKLMAAKKEGGREALAAATREAEAARAEQTAKEAELKAIDERVGKLQKAIDAELDRNQDALKDTPRLFVRRRLDTAAATPGLGTKGGDDLIRTGKNARIEGQRKLLQDLFGNATGTPTPYHAALIGRLNGMILAEVVLPGAVQATFHPNFVDQRLTVPRAWLDVYDADGGWERRQAGKVARFTPEGWLVVEKDREGRAVKARTVIYKQDPAAGPGRRFFNPNPLRWVPGNEMITIAYEDGKRVIKAREKIAESVP